MVVVEHQKQGHALKVMNYTVTIIIDNNIVTDSVRNVLCVNTDVRICVSDHTDSFPPPLFVRVVVLRVL